MGGEGGVFLLTVRGERCRVLTARVLTDTCSRLLLPSNSCCLVFVSVRADFCFPIGRTQLFSLPANLRKHLTAVAVRPSEAGRVPVGTDTPLIVNHTYIPRGIHEGAWTPSANHRSDWSGNKRTCSPSITRVTGTKTGGPALLQSPRVTGM